MVMKHDRKIVLEDGTEYLGTGFGSRTEAVCEIVFNTSMVGYQEILSDPACTEHGHTAEECTDKNCKLHHTEENCTDANCAIHSHTGSTHSDHDSKHGSDHH